MMCGKAECIDHAKEKGKGSNLLEVANDVRSKGAKTRRALCKDCIGNEPMQVKCKAMRGMYIGYARGGKRGGISKVKGAILAPRRAKVRSKVKRVSQGPRSPTKEMV